MTRLEGVGEGFGGEAPEQQRRRLKATQMKVQAMAASEVSKEASAQNEATPIAMHTEDMRQFQDTVC